MRRLALAATILVTGVGLGACSSSTIPCAKRGTELMWMATYSHTQQTVVMAWVPVSVCAKFVNEGAP